MDWVRDSLNKLMEVPQKYPGAASIITGIGALILIIAGFSNLQTTWPFIIPGLIFLGFVVYAGVETSGFKQWPAPNPGHPIARWTGIVMVAAALIFSVIGIVIAVFIACALLSGLANS